MISEAAEPGPGERTTSWTHSAALGAARLIAPAVVLVLFGLLVAGVIPGSGWTWLVVGVIFVGFALGGQSMNAPGSREPGAVELVLGGTAFLVIVTFFYYLVCRWLATSWSYGYSPLVLLLAALTAAAGVVLGVPRLRRFVMGDAKTVRALSGMLGPFALLSILFVVTTSVFAMLTVIAAGENWISLTATGVEQSFEQVSQLYIWQFCKSVPLLDINQTLRWEAPFVYTDTETGALVLLYKLAVIIPIIGAFFFYWRLQSDQA